MRHCFNKKMFATSRKRLPDLWRWDVDTFARKSEQTNMPGLLRHHGTLRCFRVTLSCLITWNGAAVNEPSYLPWRAKISPQLVFCLFIVCRLNRCEEKTEKFSRQFARHEYACSDMRLSIPPTVSLLMCIALEQLAALQHRRSHHRQYRTHRDHHSDFALVPRQDS